MRIYFQIGNKCIIAIIKLAYCSRLMPVKSVKSEIFGFLRSELKNFCIIRDKKIHFAIAIIGKGVYNAHILNFEFNKHPNNRRKSKMKKYVAMLLALMMVFALCACGGGDKVITPDDTNTVSVGAVVLARDDVSEDAVYKFVSTIFENTAAITEQHGKGAELNVEASAAVTSVPYHPGAAKYYAEKGFNVAAVKDNAGKGTGTELTFGTGGESGTYYAFGGVLSSFVSGKTDLKITAVTSGGSQANVEDLAANNVQLAFCQSDVMAYAYNGERLFEKPVEGFSVVAVLYQEQVQIVTTNGDIKSVADLAGKKVSVGDKGSGVYFNAVDVLQAYGIDVDKDISPVYQGFGDSAESLKDGKIDAAFVVAGAPTTAIVDLTTSNSVYLVSMDQAHLDTLLGASPYYSQALIASTVYGGK